MACDAPIAKTLKAEGVEWMAAFPMQTLIDDAKLGGCSNMTIWRLRRDGKLPKPGQLGNRNVTLEDDVDRAMELLVSA